MEGGEGEMGGGGWGLPLPWRWDKEILKNAALLSKSQGRRPVEVQRAAQQCLPQHINNSYVLERVFPSLLMCVDTNVCVLSYMCLKCCVSTLYMCVPI